MLDLRIQTEPFDPGSELNRFTQTVNGAGAVVSFSGIVRDTDKALDMMEIEHYPGMTEKAVSAMMNEAASRWDLSGVLVIHRHGILRAGDPIMMVGTASRHRVQAFQGAEFLMDYLKSRAPFWKKEKTEKEEQWVESRDADEQALSRW